MPRAVPIVPALLALQAALVLATWALLGTTLILIGQWRPAPRPAAALEPRIAVPA